ncbi:MAG: hypothetical protein ACREQ5_28320 [Candidatus Dormibacteria bacterium]
MASGKPTPHFHPITWLSVVAPLVAGQLEGAEEQHRLLLQARPGSLDDATVDRVVRVFSEELEFLDLYDEQFARWRKGPLTPTQRREVERLAAQVARNREVADSTLVLAEELKGSTINAILGMSDLELGLEFLGGGFPSRPPSTGTRKPPRRA